MRIAVTVLSVALMIVSVMPGQIGAQVLDPQFLIGGVVADDDHGKSRGIGVDAP